MRKNVAFGLVFIVAIGVALLVMSRSSGQSAPTTQPTLNISPEARQILNQVRDAYASLKSVTISGTLDGKFDIDGVQRSDHGEFNGLYASSGLFRSEMKETHSGDPASTQPAVDDAVLGNTGDKLYLFLPPRNRYLMADAPKGKIDLDSLGGDMADILRNQNLSLALALSGDASAELSQQATAILRVEDQKIDNHSVPSISIVYPQYDMTLSIDPQSHLLLRATADLSKNAKLQGDQDVKTALLTSTFTSTPAAGADPAAFAWSPPPGAQLLAAPEGADAGANIEGKPAPAFTLPGLDGQQVSLASLKGSVVVVDFWATWCGPCVASLPSLDKIYKDFRTQGVKFFAINLQEDKDTIQKFVNDSKLSIPVLMDSDGTVCTRYDSEGGIPFTVVIGKDGTVLKAGFLGGNEDQIRPIIQSALQK